MVFTLSLFFISSLVIGEGCIHLLLSPLLHHPFTAQIYQPTEVTLVKVTSYLLVAKENVFHPYLTCVSFDFEHAFLLESHSLFHILSSMPSSRALLPLLGQSTCLQSSFLFSQHSWLQAPPKPCLCRRHSHTCQVHPMNCPLVLSTWASHRHLRFRSSKLDPYPIAVTYSWSLCCCSGPLQCVLTQHTEQPSFFLLILYV